MAMPALRIFGLRRLLIDNPGGLFCNGIDRPGALPNRGTQQAGDRRVDTLIDHHVDSLPLLRLQRQVQICTFDTIGNLVRQHNLRAKRVLITVLRELLLEIRACDGLFLLERLHRVLCMLALLTGNVRIA